MDISLVICTRNRSAQLGATLERLRRVPMRPCGELIIVDNGSSDDTAACVRAAAVRFPRPVTALSEPGSGKGRALNRGWSAARGEIVALIDDDCYPADDYFEALALCFGEVSRLGFVGGRILLHDPADYPITIQASLVRHDIQPGQFIPAGLIQGANYACRRAAIAAVGGYDPRFGPGARFNCDEVDLVARISAAGWAGAYDPRPLVYHHHGRKSRIEAKALMREYDRGRGAYYAKSILNPVLRRTCLKSWGACMRHQKLSKTWRELRAGLLFWADEMLRVRRVGSAAGQE